MDKSYPDIHHLLQVLLERDKFPGSTVIVDLDGDDYEELPLVSWRSLNEGQYSHGLWRVILNVQVLLDIEDTSTDALLPHVYDQIRNWNTPDEGVISELKIGVESVEDGAVHDLISNAIVHGKNVSQFASQFILTIQKW